MGIYTNLYDLPLSAAVWLANDTYDHDPRPNALSATTLLKSVRQSVLSSRVPEDETPVDVSSLVASSIGTAIHDAIERAWVDNHRKSLENLNIPLRVINTVQVNPDDIDPNNINVYMENRSEKEVGDWIVTGKYDFIAEGCVEDFKSTGVYTYMMKTKNEDYIMQGSIYRWLNPELITADEMRIVFIFTDWKRGHYAAQKDKGYPKTQVLGQVLPLKSIAETESFVRAKLAEISKYKDADEADLPLCTDKELWRNPPTYKVYKDHDAKKAMPGGSKFENIYDAQLFVAKKGGIIKEIPSTVTACQWCKAKDICSQAQGYIASGELIS